MELVDLQARHSRAVSGNSGDRLARRTPESYAFRVISLRTIAMTGLVALAATIGIAASSPLSPEEGNSLARKIERIQQNAAAEPARSQTTRVSDSEANSYLAFNLKEKIPRGLANPEIRMSGDGRLAGRVHVDIDEFKRGRQTGGIMDPFSYISGQVPLTARGLLRTRDGTGQFHLIAAELHGVPLPKPLVQELVSYFSRTPERPNGFNLDQPFELPAKIRAISVDSGEAVIVQ